MPTPQQQAAAAIKADMASQLKAIQLAKKDTLKAIKKQKIETKQIYELSKVLLAEQIVESQQSLAKEMAEATHLIDNNITTIADFQIILETDKQQEEPENQVITVTGTTIEEKDGTVSKAHIAEKGKKIETEVENKFFSQSAINTVNQTQLEVNSACNIMQDRLAGHIKELGNNINA